LEIQIFDVIIFNYDIIKVILWSGNQTNNKSNSLFIEPIAITQRDDFSHELRRKWAWYSADQLRGQFPFQDPIHIATKLRTRFLKRFLFLTFGNFIATPVHVEMMMRSVCKSIHLLRDVDLNANDKMNFASAQRLCAHQTRKLIGSHVPGIFERW